VRCARYVRGACVQCAANGECAGTGSGVQYMFSVMQQCKESYSVRVRREVSESER